MNIRFPGGKSKAFTMSYDDGKVQDIRLSHIMKRYGLKGTFNINSGLYTAEADDSVRYQDRMRLSEAKELYIYSGNEVASHSFTHPHLENLNYESIKTEISKDISAIGHDYAVIPRGFAYPFGTYNQDTLRALQECKVAYARTICSTHDFSIPKDWLQLHPTCRHIDPQLMALAEDFISSEPAGDGLLFYLWGHSNEFDKDDNWSLIEDFAAYIGNRSDIWYATNIEIYDYISAYHHLQFNPELNTIHNPTDIDLWFLYDSEIYCAQAGETLSPFCSCLTPNSSSI